MKVASLADVVTGSRKPGFKCPRCSRRKPFLEHVRSAHANNYRVYGVRRMCHALQREGIDIGREQTARLMRLAEHGSLLLPGPLASYDNTLATARQRKLNQSFGRAARLKKR